MQRRAMVAVLLLLAGCTRPMPVQEEVMVFAAASLADVLEDLEAAFEAAYPDIQVVSNLAATSLLARQIIQGAPVDVFISANEAWMAHLVEQQAVGSRPVTMARNRLVVVGNIDLPALSTIDLIQNFKRIAIADPTHVPAGIYARQALECSGLWEVVQDQLIPVLDVRVALLTAEMRAADIAIVYASDTLAASGMRMLMQWPDACMPDIRYRAAAVRTARNAAGGRAFLAFLSDEAQGPIWQRHGFLPSG